MKPLSFAIKLTQHKSKKNHNLSIGEEEVLSEGASYWNIESDLLPIYENFNILSYFSPSVNIEIYDVRECEFKQKLIKIYQFSFANKNEKFYLLELYKESYKPIFENPGKDKLQIRYSVTSKLFWPGKDYERVPIKI